MTYAENIAELKYRNRLNSATVQANNTNRAAWDGQAAIQQADKFAAFSSTLATSLGNWKKEQIKKDQLTGLRQRQKDVAEDSIAAVKRNARIVKLEQTIATTKQEDTLYKEAAVELEQLKGWKAKPDADRIRHLSPWGQVGYLKEKARVFNDTLPDKVEHAMITSDLPIQLEGLKPFTPKSLSENNIHNLPMKEAAVHALTDKIAENAGIYDLSDEMLELSGTHNAIQKTKDDMMSKYRKIYNKDASDKQEYIAAQEFNGIENPNGDDIYRLYLGLMGTTDTKGNPIGRNQAWAKVSKVIQSRANGDPSFIRKLGNQELPEGLRKALGVEKGKTYAQQWPGRWKKLVSDVKNDRVKSLEAEADFLESDGDALKIQFMKEAREKPNGMLRKDIEKYEQKLTKLGISEPGWLKNYKTKMDLEYKKDLRELKELAGQRKLTEADKAGRHPQAVYDMRSTFKDHIQNAIPKKFRDRGKERIDATFDKLIKGMGSREARRAREWLESSDDAYDDFEENFTYWKSQGKNDSQAFKLSLYGKGNKEGEYSGVLREIQEKGKQTKYLQENRFDIEDTTTPDQKTKDINQGRLHIFNQRQAGNDAITDGTIPGSEPYLNEAITLLEKGKGLDPNGNVMTYYTGITSKLGGDYRNNPLVVLDAQLKALRSDKYPNGHPGLWPERGPLDETLNGEDQASLRIENPNLNYVAWAMNNRTDKQLAYAGLLSTDLINFKDGILVRSRFDQEDTLIGPLRGVG